MNYEALVPSRELCEELARLGICQDGAELRWVYKTEGWIVTGIFHGNAVIAPTLPRMLEELPNTIQIGRRIDRIWHLYKTEGVVRFGYYDGEVIPMSDDEHLPNAVARALIAVKEAK